LSSEYYAARVRLTTFDVNGKAGWGSCAVITLSVFLCPRFMRQ